MDKMQTINLDPLMMARGLINMDTNISIPKKKIYNKKKIASDLDGVIDENKQLKEIEADEE
jgi:hypothetical protein